MIKSKLYVFALLISNIAITQTTPSLIVANNTPTIYRNFQSNPSQKNTIIGPNGFNFELLDAGANSRFSEIGSCFFKNKLITTSSKKLGGIAKIDPNTNEAYKDLFCLDIGKNGTLSSPFLFSRILNTNQSEDQLAFTPNQKTVYYTKSTKSNSLEYKLYKADLEDGSHGNWVNHELLSINGENISIETPYVSPKGDQLFFASNMPNGHGGFDLYVSNINPDGTLSKPVNLGNTINTNLDDKYPSLSLDNKYLYFASKGHKNMGGYDLFISKISKNGYKSPRNLGNTINTSYDDIAFFLATKNKGYMSSNRPNGKGGFDIYTAFNNEVKQILEGQILDLETQIKLPNALVILKDDDGNEIDRQLTNESADYNFNLTPLETYTISVTKAGFKDLSITFLANEGKATTYTKNIALQPTEPVIIETKNALSIVIENIYFDFDKWEIKEESFISLNKIVNVLNEYPEMTLSIDAHTDNEGIDAYNVSLSEKRAASAVKYLINHGINKQRLQSKGFGESKPLIDCKDQCSKKDLQSNRRIEFNILNNK